jgi:AraC-like DNA-binding protein
MAISPHRESPDLAGLDVAIRLKADLLHKLGTTHASRWAEHIGRFVTALERSPLRDSTALVVLLTELREQIPLMLGIGEPEWGYDETVIAPPRFKAWTGLPRSEILARFQDEINSVLLPAARVKAQLSPMVQQTKTIIDQRYSEPLTLQELAAMVGRSKGHIATVFRKETGMTAHEYLTRVRLRRALELIREGAKIEAVSLLVGYRSKKNFYSHFNKQVGLTPLAYRAALFRLQGSGGS